MRRIIFLLATILCFNNVQAQEPVKWIIAFTDKNNSPYSIGRPAEFLSARAIERRTRFNIPIDNSDIPVNPGYIAQVLAQGNIVYYNQSKWLNQILIACNDTTVIHKIMQLPFVKNSLPAGTGKNTHRKTNTELITNINDTQQTTGTAGDIINYGTNYNQVHIHNGEFLHNKNYTGNGMLIALLDAGFSAYTSLHAFDSIRLQNKILAVKDFVSNDSSVTEDDTHGMYCLSTIAANIPGTMVGTAPGASFILLRSENGASENPSEEQNWVAAAEYADSAGADIISSSLGYSVFDDPQYNHSYNDFYSNSTIVSRGAAVAAAKGILVTNSAGNEGNNDWKYIIFPADADSICAVGAIDVNGNIASFSSYGYPGKIKPAIVSVGAGTVIYGTNNMPVMGSGTSFSNPNINGLIACLWQAFPGENNMSVLKAVYESADRYAQPDDRFGYGIPDMHKAYNILKKKENIETYGSGWLFASPSVFNDTIRVKLIAQADGVVQLALKDASGNIVQSMSLNAEEQEIYDTMFSSLSFLPFGNYTINATDIKGNTTSVAVLKFKEQKQWMWATPNPFHSKLYIQFIAPKTENIYLRISDISGRVIENIPMQVTENTFYSVTPQSAAALAHGTYLVQYTGSEKKTIKVVK